ncbi:hypothetical protein AVEN_204535-1 [Araneus ventricosus]|uniref:Uncharacterized protein n=1 Tax=Araneus ventricosus TaxID=182803 RepID=A0A4Y2HQ50_ARAVE|nr:hypothetical protein AVEN_204535-1 [Araneus ventricosus]
MKIRVTILSEKPNRQTVSEVTSKTAPTLCGPLKEDRCKSSNTEVGVLTATTDHAFAPAEGGLHFSSNVYQLPRKSPQEANPQSKDGRVECEWLSACGQSVRNPLNQSNPAPPNTRDRRSSEDQSWLGMLIYLRKGCADIFHHLTEIGAVN